MNALICFNCGLKLNSGSDNECRFCGVRFSGKCPACGFPNPQAARYCFYCGSRVAGAEGHSSVENFGTLAESRKNVAVMFADVSGFTSLSEKLDPEEVREIINECFNYITGPVYELEGTIDKYIGDCVMILFGARYIHTDDAKRAVMCAMKMMELIADFSKSMLSAKGVVLNLSIGINYGLVVTGGVGNYFDRDYTVMGDIVNTAQRLQISAGEGSILVSESVFTETSDKFEYSKPIEVKVKNKEKPVKCHKPLRINSDYFYEKELSFIERQKETGLLNSIYNEALNTGLKCVMVTGEAGLGKTRLLKEFIANLGNDLKKVWVECSSLSQNKAYSLISGILAGIMNINRLDSGNIKKRRLASFLDYILGSYSEDEIKRNNDFLGLLMGLERDRDFQSIFEAMSYESIRRELLKQLALFFFNLCEKQMLMVIVDDAQWADSSSIRIFNELVPLLKDIKAVFIFSSRYELKTLLPEEGSIAALMRLNALSRTGVRNLACAMLNSRKIDDMLFDAIIRFTKGNPLYIKELVSNIKRKGVYSIRKGQIYIEEGELKRLPENIQKLINSNISALDAISLEILQAASVIGKEFSFSLLKHLLDNTVTEEEVAGIPVQMSVIQLKSTHTSARNVDKTYEFTHEIEREVIYDSILNKEKAALHKKVAEYIEVVFTKEIQSYYETLCVHYIKAGMPKKAAEYYFKTALKQKESFNFNSSLEYFVRFLEIAGQETGAGYDEKIFNTYKETGHIHFINANYAEALSNLNKALKYTRLQDDIHYIKMQIAEVYKDTGKLDDAAGIIDEIGPRVHEGNPVYGRWLELKCNILRIKGDTAALGLAKRSEKIVLKTGDYRSLSEIMKHAGMIYFNKGDIDNALFYMNKSYKYAEKNNLLEIMAKVSGDMGIIYHSTGMISKAFEFFNKSQDISRKLSYQRGVIAACINLGILYLDKGLFLSAQKLFGESLAVSREVNSKLYECVSLTNLGDTAYETGDFPASERHYEDSRALAGDIKAPIEEAVNFVGLARIYLKSGRLDEASGILQTARAIFEEADEITCLGDCHIYQGLLRQQAGDTGAAEEHYDKAAAIFNECRNDRKRLRAVRCKGNMLIQKGLYEEAVKLYDGAVSEADRLESDYESAKCWFGRYKAMQAAGEEKEAVLSLEKAASFIAKVDNCRWTGIILSEARERRSTEALCEK